MAILRVLLIVLVISVLPKTNPVYAKEWRLWAIIIKAETGSDDPYLIGISNDEKAALVGGFADDA